MKIAVLTSSRADYGIYLPLLKALKADDYFELNIIAFGTHLSTFHGYTVRQIEKDGFTVQDRLETLILGDSEAAISNAIGNTIIKFSSLWQRLKNKIDLIISLGDRYEMFAAVTASVPFNIPVAHLHGGETTLGAIDNKFRHAITLMSELHFTSTTAYADRVANMVDSTKNIHYVGSLSLDNLQQLQLYNKVEFKTQYGIDLNIPTILNTLHPETVNTKENARYAEILVATFEELSKDFQIVITMPNADTMGNVIREKFQTLVNKNERVIGVESFGTLGYFSCMKHSKMLLGNTSSGLLEAPSLNKYVINVGDRQKGRAYSKNVFDAAFEKDQLIKLSYHLLELGEYQGENVYKGDNMASTAIIKHLKNFNSDF